QAQESCRRRQAAAMPRARVAPRRARAARAAASRGNGAARLGWGLPAIPAGSSRYSTRTRATRTMEPLWNAVKRKSSIKCLTRPHNRVIGAVDHGFGDQQAAVV